MLGTRTASWDEARSWEAEDDQFEGSFADDEEEEAFNRAGTQLNEALASETRAKQLHKREQSCMISRVVVAGSILKVQTRKAQGKGKGQGKNRDSRGRAPGQSSNAPTSQAGTRPRKLMPPSVRSFLKCGSRDYESGKCPRNQEYRSYVAHARNFTACCLGSDGWNSNSITAEAFGCVNLARGRVLLDWRATDTVGSVETIEAIIDKSQELFGADHDWVSVDTNDRPVHKFGDVKRKQVLSKVRVKVQTGHVAHLKVHAQETEGVPALLSAKSHTALGAVIHFETDHAIFRNLEPETVVQLERSPTGHLWTDLFEQMPVISNNPLSLLRQVKHGTHVGLMSRNSKRRVLAAHNDSCPDSQRTFPSRQTHEPDTPDDDNATIESSFGEHCIT